MSGNGLAKQSFFLRFFATNSNFSRLSLPFCSRSSNADEREEPEEAEEGRALTASVLFETSLWSIPRFRRFSSDQDHHHFLLHLHDKVLSNFFFFNCVFRWLAADPTSRLQQLHVGTLRGQTKELQGSHFSWCLDQVLFVFRFKEKEQFKMQKNETVFLFLGTAPGVLDVVLCGFT